MVETANTSARREFETAAADVRDRVEDATTRVRERVDETMQYFREHGAQDVMDDLVHYVKSHPTQALIGAAVLGFFAGQLIRRR